MNAASMGRSRLCVPEMLLTTALLTCVGCGGGTANLQPPPPAPQDFSVVLSANSLSVTQGAASTPISVSISGSNGFSGTVQIALSGLPSGVTSNPAGPFGVAAGTSTSVVFGAAASATTGNFTITAQGTSGALSHTASLALAVQAGVGAALPRTMFVRTDSTATMDDPPGEPRHRRISYDPANKHVFVANRAMNRVEVFSTIDGTRAEQISVPGASSADLSVDGATVWIGTVTDQVVAVDSASLQVKARYEITGMQPVPNTVFDRPEELLALSSGKLMMRLRQSGGAQALPALWNPASNTMSSLTSAEPQLFQNGLGAMARTGDHNKVLVAAGDSSGEIAIFDSNGIVLVGPHGLGTGAIPLVSANPDGSRFALEFVSNGAAQILLLDGSLNQIGVRATSGALGITFSRDGQFLYLSETSGAAPVITVLDGHDLHLIGQAPDARIQGVRSEIEEADETKLLLGIANRGVSFVDAANPGTLPAAAPAFAVAPSVQPSGGPNTGGTAAQLAGQNFEAMTQVKFGAQAANNVSVANSTQINAISPPSVASGAVNVAAYFPSGWLAVAPDAFSYGPQVLRMLPGTGVMAGGDALQVYGYGFGSDASKVSVTIGGVNAAVQKVENVTTIAPTLGLDASFPFSLERITVLTPAGTAGKADVIVTSPGGATTAAKSFQFLQSEQFFAKAALYKFVVYDQQRQWLYLSNIDHVDVFDLAAGQFHANGIQPPGGPPPNAGLRGLALTPNGTQLVVADFGAQNVYLMNPDTGTGTTVPVGGVAGFTNSGPSRVAATSAQTVFVGLSGEGGSTSGCSSCLGQLNLTASPPTIQPAPQPQVASLTGAPIVQANGSGDHVFLAFGSAPGGPVALWTASAPNQFSSVTANVLSTDLGAAADGTMFALQSNGATQIRGSDLSLAAIPSQAEIAQIPGRLLVPGVTLHPSGALIYQPFLTGPPATSGVKGGVDIIDAHSGELRLRIFLPQQFMTDIDGLHGGFLATDENGQRLFAITSTDGTPQNGGVTVVQLANVPLGIGTLTPTAGTAAGGTTLTIRGSGFQSGVTVSIGGKGAAVTFKDMNTLMVVTPALATGAQRLAITNPDGQSVAWDAAFVAN